MSIEVVLTDRIRDAIDEVLELEDTPAELKNELQSWRRSVAGRLDGGDESKVEDIRDTTTEISFKTVKKVLETLKKARKTIYLNELLQGSGLYFKPLQQPKKSPELVARLEKLQAEQDKLQYRKMVKNIDKELLYKDKKERAMEVRTTSRQLSSMVNFTLSVGGTFVFGFMSSQYAFTYVGLVSGTILLFCLAHIVNAIHLSGKHAILAIQPRFDAQNCITSQRFNPESKAGWPRWCAFWKGVFHLFPCIVFCHSKVSRVMFGLILAALVALAELYFMAKMAEI